MAIGVYLTPLKGMLKMVKVVNFGMCSLRKVKINQTFEKRINMVKW